MTKGHRRWSVLVLAGIAGLTALYFGWFRDSSLVAIHHVTVEGVDSKGGAEISSALSAAAEQMTTLHVDEAKLESAVSSFPEVASVSADAHFPSSLTVHVTERPPVAIAKADGDEAPVAADGTILRGLDHAGGDHLPVLDTRRIPSGPRLKDEPLAETQVIGAAPPPLRRLIDGASFSQANGVVVKLRGGFEVRFGTAAERGRKWAAAAAVLADPHVDSLTYIDVRVPQRPSAG